MASQEEVPLSLVSADTPTEPHIALSDESSSERQGLTQSPSPEDEKPDTIFDDGLTPAPPIFPPKTAGGRELKSVDLRPLKRKAVIDLTSPAKEPCKRKEPLNVEDVYSDSDSESDSRQERKELCQHCYQWITFTYRASFALHEWGCKIEKEEEAALEKEDEAALDEEDEAALEEDDEAALEEEDEAVLEDEDEAALEEEDAAGRHGSEPPDTSCEPATVETSGTEDFEESSEDEIGGHPSRLPVLTPEEVVREGLAGKCRRPRLKVKPLPMTDRGVIALEAIAKGSYICEYKTSSVYPARSRQEKDEEHSHNDAGSYVIETTYSVPGQQRLCFDATERYHHPGRYINHVARGPNIKLKGPYYIRKKWRIGFIAIRDIREGEELCYDYIERTEEWMKTGCLVEGRVSAKTKEQGGEKEKEPREAKEEEGRKSNEGSPSRGNSGGKAKRKPGKRRYIWCPVPGCPSGPVQKITQHLANVHHLTKHNIKKLTMHKRFAPPDAVKNKMPNPHQGRSQKTLEFSLRPDTGTKSSGEAKVKGSGSRKGKEKATTGKGKEPVQTTSRGTRDMGYHKDHPFLNEFAAHLRSTAGGSRGEAAVKQILKNASKYLYFLDSESVSPKLLLQKNQLLDYIRAVEEHGVGSSGVLQQLDAISLAIKFLRFVDHGEDEQLERKIGAVLDIISDIRKRFRVKKTSKERERLEDLAADPPQLTEVTRFLQDEDLTKLFLQRAKELANHPEQATKAHYNICLGVIAGRLLYRNSQRVSAITGIRFTEYENASHHTEGGHEYLTMRVRDHKTGSSETAKITVHGDLLRLLTEWCKVREAVVPSSPLLFPDMEGEKVVQLGRLVSSVAAHSSINLPPINTVRSVVEVKATCLPDEKKSAIARSLSHSSLTAEKHYRALEKSKTLLGYQSVGDLLEDPVVPTTSGIKALSSPKRRRFTAIQNALIESAFAAAIKAKVPPPKKEAESFLAENAEQFPNRSAHDIYDRVRNIIGRKNLTK